jgi:hypothetical protein
MFKVIWCLLADYLMKDYMYDQKFTITTNTNLGLVRLFVQYMRKIPKTSIHCRDHESINVIILINYCTIIHSIHDGSFLLSHHNVFDFVHSLLGLSTHEHCKTNWNLTHAYFSTCGYLFLGILHNRNQGRGRDGWWYYHFIHTSKHFYKCENWHQVKCRQPNHNH